MGETGIDRRDGAKAGAALRLVPRPRRTVGEEGQPGIRLRREIKERIVEVPGDAAEQAPGAPEGTRVIDGRGRRPVVQGPWSRRWRAADLGWYALLGLAAALIVLGGSW